MFYVTTPIYYVNDRPHLGHVYTTIVADVVARAHRLCGAETFFLTGVDEHAAKVADKAAEQGLTPQQWADQNAAAFREVFDKLEITHDDFVRTSSDHHKERVTGYVAALLESGDVYAGEYEGWYDAGEEEYVPETRAKQIDYKSPVSGRPLVRKKERNYFFRLSRYRDQLIELLEGSDRPRRADGALRFDVLPAARRNEIVNRIKDAEDVPMSRTGAKGWGIPVPGDPQQTIYVWVDALFNYLTYVDTDERRRFWNAGAVHFIAKDILWFHAAIWPALLLALSKCEGFAWVTLPRLVYAHSYWVSEGGEKMSKSLGNFLDPKAIENYVSEFGLDALRYFLATRGPLGVSDGTFNPDLFVEVYNSELANTFGNCASRVTNMIGKYFDGKAPQDGADGVEGFDWPALAAEALERSGNEAEALNLSGMAEAALELVRHVDGYIEATQPFKLAKDESNLPRVGAILYNCAEALRIASVLLWPLVPDKAEELWRRFGLKYAAAMQSAGGRGERAAWCAWGQLEPGAPIEKGEPLFPRYQPATT